MKWGYKRGNKDLNTILGRDRATLADEILKWGDDSVSITTPSLLLVCFIEI